MESGENLAQLTETEDVRGMGNACAGPAGWGGGRSGGSWASDPVRVPERSGARMGPSG